MSDELSKDKKNYDVLSIYESVLAQKKRADEAISFHQGISSALGQIMYEIEEQYPEMIAKFKVEEL